MLSGALAQRYAQALFEIAVKTSLDSFDTEFRELTQIIEEHAEIAQVLHHPHISLSEKKSFINKIFEGQISETLRNFLFLLIDRRRQNFLKPIQQELARLADEARQIVEAKVVSATPLSASQEERLKNELARLTGKNIRLVSELRSELIGGALVQVGDRVLDGSVARSLNRIREKLG
ncbi:MAG: F0F1 ATP synthase subunit delta [Desulfitobacteriaceae bacterium]